MNIKNIIVVLVLSFVITTAHAAPENAPPVPADMSDLYYRLGGGHYLPPPGANMVSYNVRARFRLGLGYSCGDFNFHENLQQMINQMMTQIRQIPGQLTTAASAAVAGLPGYLLQRANPTLYNIITKTLDETAELFGLSFKSCKQIEQEMRRNPGSNPYAGFMQASIAERWTIGAENGELAADVDQSIKEDTKEPIRWLGGELYGTVDQPIQVNRDIVVAGYNLMIGRTGNVSVTDAPTGALANQPIVRIWSNPEAAGRWAQEVLGDTRVVMNTENQPPDTIPGKGLRPKVTLLEESIYTALQTAIIDDDYEDMNNYTSLRMSSALVDALRNMSAGEAAVMIDRLVAELAVSEARERLMLIKQMMLTGLKAPDLVASTGGAGAIEYIRDNTFPDMDRVTQEIFGALELKQKTVNRTTISILNQHAQKKAVEAAKRSSQIESGPDGLDGAVYQ